ncbi:MAG: hypothetical protein MR598_02650 [Erysipelotrichaceae bacterium]|nr:hypothetical protein [Erysipelotrichaceae bacterium]
MYHANYMRRPRPMPYGNRIIGGGFAVPFLLGGLTGGLLAPAFYPRPYYPPYQPYPPYAVYY